MAGRKKNELTVTLYIGGQQVNELTAQQIEKIQNRLGEKMSVYYSSHLEEYTKI